MVYGTYNYSYWGESKPTYNWGASHCTFYDAIHCLVAPHLPHVHLLLLSLRHATQLRLSQSFGGSLGKIHGV